MSIRKKKQVKSLQAVFVRNMINWSSLKIKDMPGFILHQMLNDKDYLIEDILGTLNTALKNKKSNDLCLEVKDLQLSSVFNSIEGESSLPKLNNYLRDARKKISIESLRDLDKSEIQGFIKILDDKKNADMHDTMFSETKNKEYLALYDRSVTMKPFIIENIVRYYIVPQLKSLSTEAKANAEKYMISEWCFKLRDEEIFNPSPNIKGRLYSKKNTFDASKKNDEDLMRYISGILNILCDASSDLENHPLKEDRGNIESGIHQYLSDKTKIFTDGAMAVSGKKLKEDIMNLDAMITTDLTYVRKFHTIQNLDDSEIQYLLSLLYYRVYNYLNAFTNEFAKREKVTWFRDSIILSKTIIYPDALLDSPIHIGELTSIGSKCRINAYCYIGNNVHIITDLMGEVIIHSHVIIEDNCIIIGPCEINEYCIVTNGAIINCDIKSHTKITLTDSDEIDETFYFNWLEQKHVKES